MGVARCALCVECWSVGLSVGRWVFGAWGLVARLDALPQHLAHIMPQVRAFMAIVGALFGLLRRVGIKRGLARTHLWHDVREVLRERVEARDSDPMP